MRCPTEDELQMFADNAIGRNDHGKIALHLKRCKRCGARYEEIRSVITFLEDEVAAQLPVGFAEGVAMRAIAAQSARMKSQRKIAAIAILVAMSALLSWALDGFFGTVIDTLDYDFITLDFPTMYITATLVLAIGIFAIDAILYQRFTKYSLVKKDG